MQASQGAHHVLNDRYRLIERIGSGGMASVYKGQDLVLGRLVAVKILHPGLTGDETFLEKFRQEAHSVANLAHPNIVTVHDIGNDDDRHYIVMEYVEGSTIKQLIRQQPTDRPMSINRALDLTIQICAGLGYAHRAGLVHCDMKPQNVLVTRDERVKVTDFGIARAISEATHQQKQDQVWGTPQYFAPEQAQGQAATPSSDVYSVGIILFELLTGHLPFSAENHTAIALKHIQQMPPLVQDYNPAVPHQLEEIVQKVLSKEPSQRYRTAGQFGRILSTWRKQGFEETAPFAIARPVINTETDDEMTQHPAALTPPSRDVQPPTQAITPPSSRPPHRETMLENVTAATTVGPVPPRQATPSRPTPAITILNSPEPESTDSAEMAVTDWVLASLFLIAIFALLGLIPLWIVVYMAWVP